jgi:hypothetical protein
MQNLNGMRDLVLPRPAHYLEERRPSPVIRAASLRSTRSALRGAGAPCSDVADRIATLRRAACSKRLLAWRSERRSINEGVLSVIIFLFNFFVVCSVGYCKESCTKSCCARAVTRLLDVIQFNLSPGENIHVYNANLLGAHPEKSDFGPYLLER